MDLLTPENLIALLTLTALEVVLGIDNIIFISILVAKLDEKKREFARKLGLSLAMFMRIALLLGISWIMRLTEPLFSLFSHEFSGRDLILLGGGLFLIAKATHEIHNKLEGLQSNKKSNTKKASFTSVITQIILLDIIFSLDSVITAVGMVDNISIMVIAVVISVLTMLIFAKSIGDFIEEHPTFKMLALSVL